MTVRIELELTDRQIEEMAAIPATSWFTQFVFQNVESPLHPNPELAVNNDMKQRMVGDWVTSAVRGKRVLDLFAANGGFTVMAALAGAAEVLGVESSGDRVKCAEFVARAVRPLADCDIRFVTGDVYELRQYFDQPFDVVLCLGGLYHVADPAYILRQIGELTKERLILQTAQVVPVDENWARFDVRRKDLSAAGMTSILGGYGTWHYSPACLRELLLHGGFRVIEERQPPPEMRQRFPWYVANCAPLDDRAVAHP